MAVTVVPTYALLIDVDVAAGSGGGLSGLGLRACHPRRDALGGAAHGVAQ